MLRTLTFAVALPATAVLVVPLHAPVRPRTSPASPVVALALQQNERVPRVRPSIWIDAAQVRNLPMSGAGWDARGAPWFQNRGVYYDAKVDSSHPILGNNDDRADIHTLAKALVWLRLKQEQSPVEDPEPYRAQVQQACLAARGTELLGLDNTTLSLGRNLFAFVIAASIIEWDNSVPGQGEGDFRTWLHNVLREPMPEGGTVLRTLIEAHEARPNNWGLMCGSSRLAAAIYLGDPDEEQRCWDVFRRWLGDKTSPFDFRLDDWGGLSWQFDRDHPIGINPYHAYKRDCASVIRSLDGVMPDDMRRAGPFDTTTPCDPAWVWPAFPDRTDRNYNWQALQAALTQAVIHGRRGRDPWSVNTYGLARAANWLYQELQFPVTHPDAGDDDYWIPHLANKVYPGLNLPAPAPTKPGHQMGYTDWTTLDPSWP